MSTEDQLRAAFQHDARTRTFPHAWEGKLRGAYKEMIAEHGRMNKLGSQRTQSRWRTVVIAVVAVAVLSGFAYGGKLLYQDAKGGVSVRYTAQQELALEAQTLQHIRAAIRDVQQQLQPGEMALLYAAELDRLHWPALIPVANPQTVPQWADWEQQLRQEQWTGTFPRQLNETFTFAAGTHTDPHGSVIGEEDKIALAQLRQQSKQTGQLFAWKPMTAVPSTVTDVRHASYTNAAGDAIDVTMTAMQNEPGSSVQLDMRTSASTAYAEHALAGQNVHYTVNHQSFFAANESLQAVSWLQEQEGQTLLYTVSSASPNVSKQLLLDAAEQMIRQSR